MGMSSILITHKFNKYIVYEGSEENEDELYVYTIHGTSRTVMSSCQLLIGNIALK